MKKLLICLSVLFLISGCGEDNKKLTCTSTNTSNGMATDTKYDIEYKDDKIKYVTITYDYKKDTNTATDNNNDTNTMDDNTTDTNNNNNNTDGVNADTDGTTKDNDTKNDGKITSDEVIDGAVGDTIDGAVDGVKDTILDIAGIKSTYDNQINSYKDIEGFSYEIKEDTDDEYKIIYKIDMDKISDSDLTRFNLDRNLNTTKSNYEDSGYTCS